MSRVIIFGLDAASPGLVQRWAKDLPHMRRLMEEGVWGVLRSTIPPFTFPAWPCMATGKNPGRVGIFGLRYRQEGTYSFSTPNASHWGAPAIWDLASNADRRTIVFNVPGTFPPTEVNGVMVSGRPAPVSGGATITYPTDLRERLDQVVGGYQLGPAADFDDASRSDEVETWEQVLERQQKAVEYLMETEPWDLLFAVSMAIDGISHHFWKHLDLNHPAHDPEEARRFGHVIRSVYQLEDHRLGWIVEQMTPEDVLMVVSDHGSAPCHRHIAVNRWLIDNGYLVLKRDVSPQSSGLMGLLSLGIFSLYRRHAWLRRIVAPLRHTALRDAVVKARFVRAHGRISLEALPIHWPRTTAYYLGDNRLYLNVVGREPQGTVQPGTDYEKGRAELQAALKAVQDPATGQSLFAAVHAREEIYRGPYLDQAPDLVLVPADARWAIGGAVGKVVVDRPVVSGTHHPDGLLIAWGHGIRPGQRCEASVLDVAPTALHVMGLPVPEDCDGTVRLDWFVPHSPIATRPIETQKVSVTRKTAYEWTPEEEAQVKAHLRDLGYLE